MSRSLDQAGQANRPGLTEGAGLYRWSDYNPLDPPTVILDAMGKSVLSVVPGFSPVYDRLGNPAEYGDNISRIGNLGTDANDPVQTVEAEQPVFRDVGNAADYGDGYLYLDGVAGSYASIPDPIGALGDFTLQVDGLSPETVRPAANVTLMGDYLTSPSSSFILRIMPDGRVLLNLYTTVDEAHASIAVPTDTVGIRATRVGTLITYWVDTGSGYVSHDTDTSVGTVLNNPAIDLQIGAYYNNGSAEPLTGTISRAQIWDNGAQTGDPVLDADFRNATHKLTDTDTFIANSGQQITINGGAEVYNPPVASTLRTTTDDGFLDLDGVAGSYAQVDTSIMPATGDFDLSIDFIFKGPVPNDRVDLFSQYSGLAGRFILSVTSDNKLRVFWGPVGTKEGGVIVEGQRHTARLVRDNADFTLSLDGTSISTWTSSDAITVLHSTIGLGHLTNDRDFKGEIFSVTEGSNVNVDFRNLSTTLTDTDTFVATSGQTVTINGGATARRKITLNPDGFLHLDGVGGSRATIPDPLGALGDFTMQVDGLSPGAVRPAASVTLMSQWDSGDTAFILRIKTNGAILLSLYRVIGSIHDSSTVIPAETVGIRVTRVGTLITYWVDTGSGYVSHDTVIDSGDALTNSGAPFRVGEYGVGGDPLTGTISRAAIWDNGTAAGTAVVDADFRDNPSTLGDTDTLAAATGQTITINGGATAYAARVKAPKAEAGYLHLPGTAGNYASVPDAATLNGLTDFVMEAKDVYMADWGDAEIETFFAKYGSGGNAFSFRRHGLNINIYALYGGGGTSSIFPHGLTGAATASVRLTRVGTSMIAELDTGSGYVAIGTAQTVPAGAINTTTTPVEIGSISGGTSQLLLGTISRAQIWDNGTAAGTAVLDVDFDRAKANATSFAAKTGQTVTINQSTITGDRAKIVKNSEIFYDGAGDEFDFYLSSTFTGKMIVASTQGILVADMSLAAGSREIYNKGFGNITSLETPHALEQKGMMLLSDSSSPAALTSAFVARGAVKSFAARTEFGKAFRYMGLTSFPTIDISNGVNCYAAFEAYDGTTFPALNFASANNLSTAWINSPNLTSLPAIQAPVCSNFISAWNGNTALATIDPNANFGESASNVNFTNAFRSSGLTALPAGLDMSQGSSFPRAFQDCTSLTTIGDGVLFGTANATATVDFGLMFLASGLTALPAGLDMSQGNTFQSTFQSCGSLATIGTGVLLGTASSSVNFDQAFRDSGLTELPAGLDLSKGNTFYLAFYNCGSLATIDPSVLLGTALTNVNFTEAFRASGLTALPAGLDLSQGSTFVSAFYGCSSLATIGTGVLLGTAHGAATVNFTSAFNTSGLTELPAGLDMSQGSTFSSAFRDCGSLTTIGNGVLLGTANATATVSYADAFRSCTNLVTLPANLNLSKGNYFYSTFRDCSSLVTFPAGAFDTMGTPPNWCFAGTWQGNTALSGASVDAILDSIDTSGKSAPGTGPDITIDYDTGTTAPSYTTLASLKGKGWVIVVNGTTL